jgi:hypothetical protein
MQFKVLEKHDQYKHKISRWKEIIKIRMKINEMEATRTTQRINETQG